MPAVVTLGSSDLYGDLASAPVRLRPTRRRILSTAPQGVKRAQIRATFASTRPRLPARAPSRHAASVRILAVAALLTVAVAACDDGGRVPAYDITVTFNERYTDESLRAVTDIVHEFDPDADLLLQESWPPVLRGTVHTRRIDLCETLLRRLHGREDIASLNCQPAGPNDPQGP